MKFQLQKKAMNPLRGNQIFFRITDEKTLEAFKKACEFSGKSAAHLALDMVKHCLSDAGYLK